MFELSTIILLLSYVSFCSAQAITLPLEAGELKTKFLVPRFNVTGSGPEDYQCISGRSSDYYGIGVRLGVYFSWWTAWAASAGMPNEISTALDQNTVFLFANLVALVRCTITFVLTQLDALILIHLAMGTIIGVMSNWGYRTCRYKTEGVSAMKNFGGVGTHLRVLCCLGVCIYGAWYWNTAIVPGDPSLENDTGPCRTVWTFMFGKVDAAGPIRIFYLFFTILWTIHFGVILFTAPVADCIRFREISRRSHPIGNELPEDLRLATGLNYKQLRYLFRSLQIFSAFWLFWSMLTIEMTLSYNHVKNVLGPEGRIYFPSQLIPMILGAFTFARLVWKRFVQSRHNDHVDVPIEEPHKPSEKDPSTTRKLVKLMSPPIPVPKKAEVSKFNDKDIDSRMLTVDQGWRLLVSYLPWLSLLSRFKRNDANAQTETTSPYDSSRDPEAQGFWDQDTPSASRNPRSDGKFQDSTTIQSGKLLPFSRSRNKYQIDRFENTIS